MSISSTQVIVRGATVQFSTTFYDVNGAVVQPDNATINLSYDSVTTKAPTTATVPMTPPSGPAVTWTALWDTRNVQPGTIFWSIHTGTNDPIPVSVEDGQFLLSANAANLPTF